MAPEDDTGVSNSDGITSDNTPRLLVTADADAVSATVTVAGKTYTSITKNAQGQFVVEIPDSDPLASGPVACSVVVKDAEGNASEPYAWTMQVLTDLSASANLQLTNLALTQDSGASGSDFLTNQQALTFSGVVNGFDIAAQKLLIQLIASDGKMLSMAYVNPVAGKWEFDHAGLTLGVENQTTAYVIKTSVVDLAGNLLKSTSQTLVVDLDKPELTYISGAGSTGDSNQQTFTTITFGGSEKGVFSMGAFTLGGDSAQFASNTHAPDGFVLNFTDLAGNAAPQLSNAGQTWNFLNQTASLTQGPSAGAQVERIGSVGTYTLTSDVVALDVSSLYDTRPVVGEKGAINHISAREGGDDVLTLSMDDVLALGVKNSFTTSGRLQMRIDGDARDQVFLDNNMGTSKALHWTAQTATSLDGDQYSVFINNELGLELFIQQSMQLTAVL